MSVSELVSEREQFSCARFVSYLKRNELKRKNGNTIWNESKNKKIVRVVKKLIRSDEFIEYSSGRNDCRAEKKPVFWIPEKEERQKRSVYFLWISIGFAFRDNSPSLFSSSSLPLKRMKGKGNRREFSKGIRIEAKWQENVFSSFL